MGKLEREGEAPAEVKPKRVARPGSKMGRPVTVEDGVKVTFWLSARDVEYIDLIKGRKGLSNRSEVVRGIIGLTRKVGIR